MGKNNFFVVLYSVFNESVKLKKP